MPYDTSAHFLWIGERTRELDGAHVDFLARVRNPIGVKLGPSTSGDDALRLIDKLDPDREPGRLTFITRMGAEQHPREAAPDRRSGHRVRRPGPLGHGPDARQHRHHAQRLQDPPVRRRHGRGPRASSRCTTRLGTVPGGLHIEMTGDDVTECLGGADQIDQEAFLDRYESVCDPRLNHMQSLEMAFLVAGALSKR